MFNKLKIAYMHWWARRLPDCDSTTRMISDAMDRQITIKERLQIRLHNHICAFCARYERQLRLMRDALRKGSRMDSQPSVETSGPVLSSDARERLKRKLSQS